MPSTRDIRRRIRSVKNTSQITKAMQTVAASKMRRAQLSALAGRPYATLMNEVMSQATENVGDFSHPLLEVRSVQSRAVIIVSSDKGLAGALNGNLFRELTKFATESTTYIAAGKKGSQYIARTRRQLAAEFTYKDSPSFSEARAIARFAREAFLNHEVDQVDVLFTNFLNTLSQKAEIRTLLPIRDIKSVSTLLEGEGPGEALAAQPSEFLFEASADAVFGALLPHYLNFQMYQILLEAKASEHSARMVAMKNATDNAKQLIGDLTLEYNKLRQSNITNELLEITSATLALS
jgi:F-type H+-transporting ATPase subunit gamma